MPWNIWFLTRNEEIKMVTSVKPVNQEMSLRIVMNKLLKNRSDWEVMLMALEGNSEGCEHSADDWLAGNYAKSISLEVTQAVAFKLEATNGKMQWNEPKCNNLEESCQCTFKDWEKMLMYSFWNLPDVKNLSDRWKQV